MHPFSRQILEEADRCVKCGYCLPVCPTYLKTRNEAESPRGRIALVQGMIEGALDDTSALEGHLQHCLTCLACEPACPSGVRYRFIIDGARTLHTRRRPVLLRFLERSARDLITHPLPLRTGARLLRLYRKSGLKALVGGLLPAPLRRAEGLLPPDLTAPRWRRHYPATAPRGRVDLFTGCIGRLTDRAALQATITMLNRLGYSVDIPPGQGCCGAIHRHAGDPDRADRLAARNGRALDRAGAMAVIGVASACCAELQTHLPDGGRVMDIITFLDRIAWPEAIRFRPLPRTVAIHEPCSQRLLIGHDPTAPYRLLRRIPQIDLRPVSDNDLCCGAAGTYMLSQPAMADALLGDKLDALRRIAPHCLLTSNTGCALHLGAGLRAAGLQMEVLHPVELLARQLSTDP